jgi:hypothetical protein
MDHLSYGSLSRSTTHASNRKRDRTVANASVGRHHRQPLRRLVSLSLRGSAMKPAEKPPAAPLPNYEIRVVGAPPTPWRDLYHALLRLSWTRAIGLIVGVYLLANLLFAIAYTAAGGVTAAWAPRCLFSASDHGNNWLAQYPESTAANIIVVVESTTGWSSSRWPRASSSPNSAPSASSYFPLGHHRP